MAVIRKHGLVSGPSTGLWTSDKECDMTQCTELVQFGGTEFDVLAMISWMTSLFEFSLQFPSTA